MYPNTFKYSLLTVACLLALTACKQSASPAVDEVAVKGVVDHSDYGEAGEHEASGPESPADAAVRKAYSPYAGKGPAEAPPIYPKSEHPMHVFFGDTHHHTNNSGDAFMGGNTLTPEQAYRFARGEEVVSSTGVPIRLSRPMDFLVISDHAEGLGIMAQVAAGNPA
jgi:hypothetical protein